MKNNAHINETKDRRLKRLREGSYVESIETLLNSIDNFFNNEIRAASENYQTSLLFMGIHASALTISEVLFNKSGHDGYKAFLKTYVDGDEMNKQFSLISNTIHNWRNLLAHQWIGSMGHEIGYDYSMNSGWELRENVIFINPRIYCEQYLSAFSAGGKIWNYRNIFNDSRLESVKSRIINKYLKK